MSEGRVGFRLIPWLAPHTLDLKVKTHDFHGTGYNRHAFPCDFKYQVLPPLPFYTTAENVSLMD